MWATGPVGCIVNRTENTHQSLTTFLWVLMSFIDHCQPQRP